jgi:hypothetical protein
MLIPLLNYSHINTWTGWADGGNVTAPLAFAQGAPSSELRLASIVLPNKTNNATAHPARLSYFHGPAPAWQCHCLCFSPAARSISDPEQDGASGDSAAEPPGRR